MASVETWLAIAATLVGILLIFLEIYNPGFFIAIPGTVLAGLGILSLAAPQLVFGAAAWFVVPGLTIIATVGTLYGYKRWAPPGEAPVTMTKDSLPGHSGKVTRDIPGEDGTGRIRVAGGTWSARSDRPIPVGTPVRVIDVEGVYAIVEPEPAPAGADPDPQSEHKPAQEKEN